MCSGSWKTPFVKQCYVTAGVSINMVSHGLVAGFSAVLLPQLRRPDSSIQVDESSESWIASVFGVTFIIGNLINPIIMDKYGRRKANLIAKAIMTGGWYIILWASNIPWLILSRTIQGFSMGLTAHLCPIIIGEYTSPKNRGSFLATISLAISCGLLIVHSLGSILAWKWTALFCAIFLTIDFFTAIFSPETPSWLVHKGRYYECQEVFRWLRGFDEEEELKIMLETNITLAKSKDKIKDRTIIGRMKNKLGYFRQTVTKKEFYKPIFVVIHLYALSQLGGSNILSQYTGDIFHYVVGDQVNLATMTVALTFHRVISGIFMTFVMRRFNRRTLLISLSLVNVIVLILIACYSFARVRNCLPFDQPGIGVVLIHIQMFSVCSGTLTIGFVIAGELFPLEYKGLAGGISSTFLSGSLFIVAKTAPYLFTHIGIHFAYCIYAGVSAYCFVIIWLFLPETKGRTLQEIEEGLRNKVTVEAQAVPLTSCEEYDSTDKR